jgi:four helix bundle suffix protein
MDAEPLIPQHGGYRNLKSFQLAQLVYDVTVSFCDRHIDRRSRTHDQMVQAARSGVQNIAEGSQASGTSRKSELKLTNVARASLEELRLDYEDFLRQRKLDVWSPQHPALQRFRARRCATVGEVHEWLGAELTPLEQQAALVDGEHGVQNADNHGRTRTGDTPMNGAPPVLPAQLEANAALSLLNLCCHLLNRQLDAQAAAFEREGGFTERLYHTRQARRQG